MHYSLINRKESKSKTDRKSCYNDDADLLSFIQEKLDDNYSPNVICGLLRSKNITSMCTQTVCNLISICKLIYKNNTPYKDKKVKELVQKVAFNNTSGRSILERPFKMTDRIFGNWEMDTVVGKRGTKHVLLVLTECLTRYEMIVKLKDKTQKSVITAIYSIEKIW